MVPEFENEFLADVARSVKKRHKALKHSIRSINCDKVYEADESGEKSEKLELTLRQSSSPKGLQLRLFAWPDRWVWVDARQAAKKGWKWEWTHEGRLLGVFGGRDLISAVEKALFDSIDDDFNPVTSEVAEIWRPLLAKGPVRVS